MTDGQGIPLAITVTAGQRHESTQFEPVLAATPFSRQRFPGQLAADKGYSSGHIRSWLEARDIAAVIPRRKHERTSTARWSLRDAYRRRNVVERCVGWLKESRRIATRFEKLAVNYLAMLKIAMLERYLRLLIA